MGSSLSAEDLSWLKEKTGESESILNKAYKDYKKDMNGATELNFENFCAKIAQFQGRYVEDIPDQEKEGFKHLFRAFDRDGNGFINFRSFFIKEFFIPEGYNHHGISNRNELNP
ncbi:neuronal calcium sensor 2 [Eurytemora carolleeae]|uniref:neuronal calcium sensor 2 n=1 Tax=Eurytemora carolleeae TaxID=1294199 RepID=UPI000C77A3A0|nr:neuronal calcium sensor 2 [Eurytemora carolleeae]|eukprot:XP_023339967.1 neuronal calcium sensor 2-like [Eurytemora affinis]